MTTRAQPGDLELFETLDALVIKHGLGVVLQRLADACGDASRIYRDNVYHDDDAAIGRKFATVARRLSKLANELPDRMKQAESANSGA